MATPASSNDSEVPAPTFDLETWVANYEGPLLPLRLAHVAKRCPSLRRQSLTLALARAQEGKDTQVYGRICELARAFGISDLGQPDESWISRTEQGNQRELARLEGELRGYKNNLIRESIRMGQDDLASHLLATGGPRPDPANPNMVVGYNAAFQAYGKMRDYCTTPSQLGALTLRLICTSLLQAVTAQQLGAAPISHFMAVHPQTTRLRALGCKAEEQTKFNAIAQVASGVALLGSGNFAEAAKAFLQAPSDYNGIGSLHNINFERFIASANDVAIYGGLCALGTMSREELAEKVLGGPFRQFLEREPHLRKAIGLYVTAKYQQCIALLQHYRADWTLDIFLSAQVDRLFALIRQRSITAYFSSFSQVSFESLAATFPPSHPLPAGKTANQCLEDELISMIQRGLLDARIDPVDGMLLAPQRDPRHDAHAQAQRTAADLERTLSLRLHRVNVLLAGLEVRPEARPGMTAGGL